MTINISTLFVERKSTLAQRSVSNFNTTPTPTAQPMIGTERLHMGINDAPAGWSSTFDTVHGKYCRFIYIFQYDHDTTGLRVTFGGVADWKSRQLKPTAQSTTEHRNRHMIDASNGMSGDGMAWFGFCLLSSVCFLSVLSMA
jgi:hypothetical protein